MCMKKLALMLFSFAAITQVTRAGEITKDTRIAQYVGTDGIASNSVNNSTLLKMPPKDVLKSNFIKSGLENYVGVTRIIDELADKNFFPMNILGGMLGWKIQYEYNLIENMSTENFRKTVYQCIFKQHPLALKFFYDKGYYK